MSKEFEEKVRDGILNELIKEITNELSKDKDFVEDTVLFDKIYKDCTSDEDLISLLILNIRILDKISFRLYQSRERLYKEFKMLNMKMLWNR